METISTIIGWVGLIAAAAAGLVALYHAKSNKNNIDVGTMQKMLDEAHKMFDKAIEDGERRSKELQDYKTQNTAYVDDLKARLHKVEERQDRYERIILRAYRCDHSKDCLVIAEYEKEIQET